ncbi:MAG: tRNA (guanosine(46)-N7)-methyltransferase TrmB [Loktanella sp.]|nr:tRNA (guanosine(46)-N7)-methyltransferase TrmB [Loktanella sp.]
MRMRRKKNLDERLARVADRIFNLQIENRRFDATQPATAQMPACLPETDRPIELEIGCGKGGFICEMAARHPDVFFIAVEKYSNVLVSAAEAAKDAGLDNILFVWGDAEYLGRLLLPGRVRRIYLNFSTPFPKKRHATHRLTHAHFLMLYRSLLAPGGSIIQKTDDRGFFQFSLEQFSQTGYRLDSVSLDLHADTFPDNIITEYEQRFIDRGLPIYRVEACPIYPI